MGTGFIILFFSRGDIRDTESLAFDRKESGSCDWGRKDTPFIDSLRNLPVKLFFAMVDMIMMANECLQTRSSTSSPVVARPIPCQVQPRT